MNFAEKVIIAREKLGLSQERLAALLGVSFSTVNRWEKGHANPSYLAQEKFMQICKEKDIHFEED